MLQGNRLLIRAYQAYLQRSDHPAKLRIERLMERFLVPPDGAPMRAPHGFTMLLSPRETGEMELIRGRTAEPLTLSFIERNVHPGHHVLMAGITNGIDLMLASRAAGHGGMVVGVEPQPLSLRRTMRNVLLNDLPDNVRLVSGALGERPALIPISEPPAESTGWSSMVLRDAGRCPFEVAVQTVPDVLSKLGMAPHLDLMLLDVEGYELPVLRGMENVRPQIFVLEVHPTVLKLAGVRESDYYNAMTDMGYQIFDLHGQPAYASSSLPENNAVGLAPGATAQWA